MKNNFKYGLLDPRKGQEANNDPVFSGSYTYGIEVTIPALAGRCSFNLDPQHTGGNGNSTAIEEAVNGELPPDGATLVTIRPDLDSVGAMAILKIREQKRGLDEHGVPYLHIAGSPLRMRIQQVAESDRFARGGYPGQSPSQRGVRRLRRGCPS